MKLRRQRSTHLVAWTLLLGASAALAWMSWLGWGEPLIDLSREVYVPWQLRAGRILYRTLTYNYGPVAPYLLAAVTAMCGDTLKVYAWFGASVGVVTMAALYVIGCRLANVLVGFTAALLFVVHSFFGYTTWGTNYVLPYAYAATLSMALALWSLAALLRCVDREFRGRGFYVGVVLAIASALTKLEVGFAIVLVWMVAFVIHRVRLREVIVTGGLAVGTGAICLALFTARAGEHALLAENLLKFAGGSAGRFFADVAGVGRWRFNLFDPSAYALAVPMAAGLLLFAGVRSRVWLLALFMLCCAPRIFLAYSPTWYGFSLFAPGYLVVTMAVWTWLSRWKVAVAGVALLAAIIGWRSVAAAASAYAAKTETLRTSKGDLRDEPTGRVAAIDELTEYLQRHADPAATMVVLPEGAFLNWVTGLANPTAYYNFIPPEVAGPEIEQRMVAELNSSQPTFVAVVARSLAEFHVQDFGYMRALMADVERHYALAAQFGDPTGRLYRIALLKRTNEK